MDINWQSNTQPNGDRCPIPAASKPATLIALLSRHTRPDNAPIWSIHRFWIHPNNASNRYYTIYTTNSPLYILQKTSYFRKTVVFIYIAENSKITVFASFFIIWEKHIYSKNTHIRKIAIY